VFLQDNERKKNKAAEKIKQERQLKEEKEEEYQQKMRKYQFLEKQAQRIESKKRALMKYEDFLEKVKANSDEFSEIKDILDRYDTLCKENQKLDHTYRNLEDKLKDIKKATSDYIKDKSTEQVKLTNDIGTKNAELERILDEQNKLKAEAEEVSSKKLGKVSELAQILMAIDNIEVKCFNRQGTKQMVRHVLPSDEEKPKNFDDLEKSVRYAKMQLSAVKNYLFDYKKIYENIQDPKSMSADGNAVIGDKDIQVYLQELKNNSDLI
jgi:chromosome segregation ATPase